MAEPVYFCPECRTPSAEAGLTARGPLLRCPNCDLLFQSWREETHGAVTARKLEGQWSAHGLAVTGAPADKPVARSSYRSPRQSAGKRRRRQFRFSELWFVWAAALAILVIAGGISFFVHRSVTDAKFLVERIPAVAVEVPLVVSMPPADDSEPLPETAPKPAVANDQRLLGEWGATDHPIENPEGGEVYAILLSPDGTAQVRSRHKLESELISGRWKLTDSTLTLSFGSARFTAAVEFAGDDRMRLRIPGQNPIEFARKPPE